jgi:restriction endonuclease Mrr
MAIPTKRQMYPMLLRVLQDRAHSRRELIEAMADETGITPEERAVTVPSGGLSFETRVGFALKDLKSAGFVRQPARPE